MRAVLLMILLVMVRFVAVVPLRNAPRKVQDSDVVHVGFAQDAETSVAELRKKAFEVWRTQEYDENEEKLKQVGGMLGVWKLLKEYIVLAVLFSVPVWCYNGACVC